MNSFFLFLLLTATVISCIGATQDTVVTVSQSPQPGQFSTIQAAVDSLSTTEKGKQTIHIRRGTYREQVKIAKRKSHLKIVGESDESDSHTSSVVKIAFNASQADGSSNDASATLSVHASNFSMHNVEVINDYGAGSQAVALSAQGDKQAYYHCQFVGFQDTVLSERGRHYFHGCEIEGAVDFIFGQYARAWFEKCLIGVRSLKTGWITASGAKDPSGAWYVLNRCKIVAARGHSVPRHSVFLGRPWGKFAKVNVQHSFLSSIINPLGWSVWNEGDERTSNVHFREFDNDGPGAETKGRASFMSKSSRAVTLKRLFEDYSWIEEAYL
ncbi:hypothetical protein CBS101457_006370 [Exobasidium rhododendri]|nr:hypothetical protein CBS101457_006370 [Exobasidium rhododendri]